MPILLFVAFAALCSPSVANVANLQRVSRSVVHAHGPEDLSRLWNELQGDKLIASAVETRDREQLQAAVLLTGKLLSEGLSLDVASTNKLGGLCGIILAKEIVKEFASERMFQRMKKVLLDVKRTVTSHDQFRVETAPLFPWMNLHYVCGNDLPLVVKVAIFKARVARSTVTRTNNFDRFQITPVSFNHSSLEDLFRQFLRMNTWPGTNENELGLVFNVRCKVWGFLSIERACTSQWLARTIRKMFPSDYFQQQANGTYALVSESALGSLRHIHILIGQLLALAVMNNVAVPVALYHELLQALLTDTQLVAALAYSRSVHLVRAGFYSVTSKSALLGSNRNPKPLFNETELNEVLMKHF